MSQFGGAAAAIECILIAKKGKTNIGTSLQRLLIYRPAFARNVQENDVETLCTHGRAERGAEMKQNNPPLNVQRAPQTVAPPTPRPYGQVVRCYWLRAAVLVRPRADLTLHPAACRIQSRAQMVASAEPPAPPTAAPPPPGLLRREDLVFWVGTSWEKEEITGGCSQTDWIGNNFFFLSQVGEWVRNTWQGCSRDDWMEGLWGERRRSR